MLVLYPRRAEEGWFVTFWLFLPHTPALFVTSLIQTAGGKMSLKIRLSANRTRHRVKTCCVAVSFHFCHASSVWFRF